MPKQVSVYGICNVGNNCYIIACIQLLCMIDDIRYLVSQKLPENTNNPIIYFLNLLHAHTLNLPYNPQLINHYKKLLGFNNDQNDVTEFLNIFLEKIKTQDICMINIKKKFYKCVPLKELVSNIKNHKYLSSNITGYNVIELQFDYDKDKYKYISHVLLYQSARSIYKRLKTNKNPDLQAIEYEKDRAYEVIDYSFNKYLIIRIQAFNSDHTKKFHKLLLCDENYKTYDIMFGKYTFKLLAVICHIGKSLHSGHYICYVNLYNNWYKCDDNNTYKTNSYFLSPENYVNELPYVVLYELIK